MKKYKLISALILSLAILSGCASSPQNAPENMEITTENVVNESITEITTENVVNESITEITTETLSEVTTYEITETTTKSENSVLSIDPKIKEKANSNIKQSTNHNTSSKPTETTAPEGVRIVATSGAVCDIMDRLGLSLVGIPDTSVSEIASRYKGITTVGSPMSPDMEVIKSLNPTDVIGPDSLENDLKIKYDNIGVNSTFLNLKSVKGLYDSVKIIGDKYGKSKEAEAIIKEYSDFISGYKSKHKDKSPKVLVLMGLPGSYLVATQNSYAGSLVELAGGINIFHHSTKDFITVNPEEMLAQDPDVIIRTAHGIPKDALEMFEKEFTTNDIWKHFRAVENGRVYDVDYMLFGMSATFDYPQALQVLEPMLYGE
ncbi:MAG: heme ABC transporter substrate-binding protein IsdE [Lachnospirales bacterium]